MNTEELSVISIDIGLRNLGLCKEYYSITNVKNCKPPKELYDEKGGSCTDMKRFIEDIACCGRLVHWEKKDLGDKKVYHTQQSFIHLIQWLDELKKQGLFQDVHVILIEQQMKTNFIATSLMHHIHSYFLIHYQLYKQVILYPSKNKTRVLGAPFQFIHKGKTTIMNKYQRKKWSVNTVTDLLTKRNDNNSLELLKKESKKDDLCDTISQLVSYIVMESFKVNKIKATFTTLKKLKKKKKLTL